MRCHHEASLHTFNSFITLTYDPDHLPNQIKQYLQKQKNQNEEGKIREDLHGRKDYDRLELENNVSHFQIFMKRLRHRVKPLKIRFFHCGEYGDKTRRPHYHALIFGYGFPDKKIFKKQKSGDLFTSDVLTKCWGKGHCLLQPLHKFLKMKNI
jgi:hypothetical protein